ncbi:MAG: GDSL-type esterase/lipase family protein [Myxococcota bacterium]
MTSDRDGLRALAVAFATAGLCAGASYLHPAGEPYRPWVPGDPVPVLAALLPRTEARVVERAGGELVVAPSPEVAATAPSVPVTLAAGTTLPPRPPGVATPLVDAGDRGMDPFYRALHGAAAGEGIARASHWGDSTIAADGITSTVRARLQARFGDGGPGYLSAGMDPRWSVRSDVIAGRQGAWDTVSLLNGGGGGRYGFGGIASTAQADAWLTIRSPKRGDAHVPMHHFELWYQVGPERGSWWASVDGKGVGGGSALAENPGDRWHVVDVPDGYVKAAIGASGGPVTFYGVVMETKGPGVTWDALGVVGVGSRSFTQHGRRHIQQQVERRAPDLLVVQLGGNELGWPILAQGDGSAYVPYFQEALHKLRAGAPEAGCLIVTPLDQGTRDGGAPATKPSLPRLVSAQRKVAELEGCAFWDAYAAMGGSGSVVRWSQMRPPLAWADLVHLSAAGQDIVGQLLADAIEAGYDAWVASGGPARPRPAAPGVAATP